MLTPIAMTKFFCRFLNPKNRETTSAHKYDIRVCTMKIKGMMARSTSFSAVNCEASLLKTAARVSRDSDRFRRWPYLGME